MKIADSSIRNIAKTALKNMEKLQREDQIKLADMYLGTIENTSEGATEKQIASLTRRSTLLRDKPLSKDEDIAVI